MAVISGIVLVGTAAAFLNPTTRREPRTPSPPAPDTALALAAPSRSAPSKPKWTEPVLEAPLPAAENARRTVEPVFKWPKGMSAHVDFEQSRVRKGKTIFDLSTR